MMNDVWENAFNEMRGPLSRILSKYRATHTFIRCPNCGNDYAIDDPEMDLDKEILEHYKNGKGDEIIIKCDEIHPKEVSEALEIIGRRSEEKCSHQFTLNEGLIEYQAQIGVQWFSRGPYTAVEDGVVDIVVGTVVQPELHIDFETIDYVQLIPQKPKELDDIVLRSHTIGRTRNKFQIIAAAGKDTTLGQSIRVSWQIVGLRRLSQAERDEIGKEPWRSFLRSSATILLYDFDPRKSILLSFNAFELFLEAFIDQNWNAPHLKDNRKYLRRVAGFSTETTVRIMLHEALGIQFVKSKYWNDWLRAKAFRNQVAHGGKLEETKFNNRKIAEPFKGDSIEIARFCYSTVVRSIFFIIYSRN